MKTVETAALLLRALQFAANKHRDQRRKDAGASPYINHPIAVANVLAELTDDKRLPKAERKRLQVERAPGASDRAKLVKLADKICNVLDVTHSPPASWRVERRREYLDWTERVVAGCRGSNGKLERYYDSVLREARGVLEADGSSTAAAYGNTAKRHGSR
jgi:guanosine-3',5'-bis(diphosphate) 3'-pyrophosphohydrolase